MLLQKALLCSFLWLSNIPIPIPNCLCVCIFLIHSSISGHLGRFHVFTITNSAAMNIGEHVSF